MDAIIDQAIERIEQLYAAITGTRPPPLYATLAPIPADKDPFDHVTEQLAKLVSVFETPRAPVGVPAAASPRAVTWVENGATVFAIDLRTFAIPSVLPPDRIAARLEGGVLTVRVQHQAPADGGSSSQRS